MTGSALLDRIGEDLVAAARSQQPQPRAPRFARGAIQAAVLLGALAFGAAISVAAGVGPFDRLFANTPMSRPAADPATITIEAPAGSDGWSVIAYRRDDGGVGLSAALDAEVDEFPSVNWTGTAILARGFKEVGPVSLRAQPSRDPDAGSWLIYGLTQHGMREISVRLDGRQLKVYRSSSELTAPLKRLDGTSTGKTLSVGLFAAPISGVPPGTTATARVTAVGPDGRSHLLAIPLE